ncbi:MAG: Fe-S cluster assembly protein SufD [Bacteroidales bacterium]|jgi:Fe-S cluster assembly protein SufD|nr:Fe-S cluster assembly protein SufD [Bacteroidales bacterium]
MSALIEKTDLSLRYTIHYNKVKEQFLRESPLTLNAPRDKAFCDFVSQGIPTTENENYKYTNLQPQFSHEFKFAHQPEKVEQYLNEKFNCDITQLDTQIVFTINGWYCQRNKKYELFPEGIILCSLKEAVMNNPDLIEKYYTKLAKTEEDPLVALNTAFAQDGYFLYIPKNTDVEKPIQIINLLKSDEDTYTTHRNLVVIEEGANIKMVLCHNTLNNNKYMSNSVTEIYVGTNANLDYYTIQNQHNDSSLLNFVFIQQEKNSKVTAHTSSLHGGLIRNNLKIILNGENSEINVFGMAVMDSSQHIDNFAQITHTKPNCQSNQLYKNVLDNFATGVFSGRIHVMRDAQKTNAFQRNNNIMLTDNATMKTKPQLIIDADDVKCSHGATVGQIDEEVLFYLRTRGIEESKARLMMMNAFVHEVIQEIKIEVLREQINELVEKRLNGEYPNKK